MSSLIPTIAGAMPPVCALADSLGEPMRYTRSRHWPVTPRQGVHLWEFQSLRNPTVVTVIAVEVRDRRIVRWRHLATPFEQAVRSYQTRLDQPRDRPVAS